MRALQSFSGHVVETKGSDFIAIISDLTDPSHSDEQVTFSMGILSEGQRGRVQPGACFRWTISKNGSRFWFSRARWTKEELARVKRKARRLAKNFEAMP